MKPEQDGIAYDSLPVIKFIEQSVRMSSLSMKALPLVLVPDLPKQRLRPYDREAKGGSVQIGLGPAAPLMCTGTSLMQLH